MDQLELIALWMKKKEILNPFMAKKKALLLF